MFISLCILCKSKPSDVSVSTVKSLFTDVAVPIICNFGKRFHSGPLFYDFRILLALFSFVPNFSRGSWLQGIVFIFGFRVCIEHILWTWVFKFSFFSTPINKDELGKVGPEHAGEYIIIYCDINYY